MKRIARFEKVSEEQFLPALRTLCPDLAEPALKQCYAALPLPRRATSGSAGYDFRLPCAIELSPRQTVKIPTGIRCTMEEGWVLQLFPRSSLGFRYRLQLNNTVGIVDADYYHSDNEGHIFIKITNDALDGSVLSLQAGDAFAQGIFLPFGITEDDACDTARNGGFGSTGA